MLCLKSTDRPQVASQLPAVWHQESRLNSKGLKFFDLENKMMDMKLKGFYWK